MQGIVLEENRLVVTSVEKEQGKTCRFHAANGCRLHPEMRDTVCRLYVCPGIGLWREAGLLPWQNFFGALVQQEYELQELMAGQLKGEGLTLAESTWQAVAFLTRLNPGLLESDMTGLLYNQRELSLAAFPPKLVKKITRQISRTDWVV
ncbi:MAG TPA: hypothetical protein VNU93_02035 [Verrucomicrobiae bacterium]|nr:hypothetical protein [Verrucomicrobiae bacterium]